MPETECDAIRIEVCGGVVAKELGVAEDEAGSVVVVRIPRDERKNGESSAKTQLKWSLRCKGSRAILQEKHDFPQGQSYRSDDGRLLGQCSEGRRSTRPRAVL